MREEIILERIPSPDDNPICQERNSATTGFNSFYDVTKEVTLLAGTVVTVLEEGESFLFEVQNDVDVLDDKYIQVEPGTYVEYLGDTSSLDAVAGGTLLVKFCRPPTRKEYEWYLKNCGV